MKTNILTRLIVLSVASLAVPMFAQGNSEATANALNQQVKQQARALAEQSQAMREQLDATRAHLAAQQKAQADQLKLAMESVQQKQTSGSAVGYGGVGGYGGGGSFVVSRSGGGAEQPLIVSTQDLKPDQLSEMREDLSVMTKLVDDAIEDREGRRPHRAMGINVTTLFSSDSAARALYVEGQGAIIQARVPYPLKPEVEKETSQTPTTDRNSAWDQARRELYGGAEEVTGHPIHRSGDEPEPYDARKVESLKQAIIKALENANNFRHMKDDETVTVAIRTRADSPNALTTYTRALVDTPFGQQLGITTREQKKVKDNTLTICVKKSDADALADGKITEQEFRDRAAVALY